MPTYRAHDGTVLVSREVDVLFSPFQVDVHHEESRALAMSTLSSLSKPAVLRALAGATTAVYDRCAVV